ncbi:MAG TPA: HNH endonuclease signature motif containing protein, partial [Pirellulaceae bacterium]|nr:HNH endonuclease signature motif containing protein [Pirellulaceae bacterium]
GKLWTRDETLVAFNLYCRTPFGRLHARNPEIIALAHALGRTPDSVAMKCCNLAAFDETHQKRGIRGLSKGSKQDADVWHDFQTDPESIALAAEEAYAHVMRTEPRQSPTVEWEDVQGLDRQAITKVRVNQHFFRSLILASYRSQCAVCELPIPELLVASHIVPWSVDPSLRMNPTNGICLCSLHDRAFDTGILSITPEYTIAIRADVRKPTMPPVVDSMINQYSNHPINLPERWQPDSLLLARHCQNSDDRSVNRGEPNGGFLH